MTAMRFPYLFTLFLLLPLSALNGGTPLNKNRYPIQIGDAYLVAQIVTTPQDQQTGLMYQSRLQLNEGMLFVFKYPQQAVMWMKNTALPLSIGFFDKRGVLLEVRDLIPFDTSQTRSKSKDVRYALEMRQGWFEAQRVRPGEQLNLKLIEQALEAEQAASPQAGRRARAQSAP